MAKYFLYLVQLHNFLNYFFTIIFKIQKNIIPLWRSEGILFRRIFGYVELATQLVGFVTFNPMIIDSDRNSYR